MLHTIVIGGGQAGLAAGYYLRRAGVEFRILEAGACIGDNWRRRWEGLELFTPQRYNALPGLAPEGDDWDLIDRMQAADYLERYAAHHSLPVTLHRTCVGAKKKAEGWEIETQNGTYRSRNIVVATGAYKDKHIPEIALPADLTALHSSEVRNVEQLLTGPTSVLVVGAGASGQQLARLAARAGAEVTLTGPSVANLPRQLLGKDIYWWLYKSKVMEVPTYGLPGKLLQGGRKGIVTVGEPAPPPAIRRFPKHLDRYENGRLHFRCPDTPPLNWPAPGHRGVVIWCTGYRNHYPFLPPELLDQNGQPRHRGGVSTVDNSVRYLGLENLRRPNSSLLGGVGRDAKELLGDSYNV